MPQAVCRGGRVQVRAGFMMANWGLLRSEPRPRFSPVASLVSTAESEVSLPAAAMVSTEPLGRLAVTSALPR